MNHSEYTTTMKSLIDSVYEEFKRDDTQELMDICHETADSSEYVIYFGKAWDLVSFVRLHDFDEYLEAQDILEDIGEFCHELDTLMTKMGVLAHFQHCPRCSSRAIGRGGFSMKQKALEILGVVLVYVVFCTTLAMALLGITFGELFGGLL